MFDYREKLIIRYNLYIKFKWNYEMGNKFAKKWSLSEYENPKRYDIENKSLSDFPFYYHGHKSYIYKMNGF